MQCTMQAHAMDNRGAGNHSPRVDSCRTLFTLRSSRKQRKGKKKTYSRKSFGGVGLDRDLRIILTVGRHGRRARARRRTPSNLRRPVTRARYDAAQRWSDTDDAPSQRFQTKVRIAVWDHKGYPSARGMVQLPGKERETNADQPGAARKCAAQMQTHGSKQPRWNLETSATGPPE